MLVSGCGPAVIDTPGRTLALTAGDVAVPVHSMAERRFLTVVRQRYDFSCGSAALATLLRFHYGNDASEQSVFMGMWRNGDRPQISKRDLAAHGVRAEGYVVSLDDIARTRVPGIALINVQGYRHFVVVKGVEGGQVLVGDPSLGIRLIDVKSFGATWNGILFALVDGVADSKRSFGREAEWALVARSDDGDGAR
jgi:predicted double-glycine peptidase